MFFRPTVVYEYTSVGTIFIVKQMLINDFYYSGKYAILI